MLLYANIDGTKKTTGYHQMPIMIIQDNIDILAEPLSVFYNACFHLGVFPEQLKIIKIIPIYKRGIKTDPRNYRPIITLSQILGKILEQLMKVCLLSHLERNKILNRRQFGY